MSPWYSQFHLLLHFMQFLPIFVYRSLFRGTCTIVFVGFIADFMELFMEFLNKRMQRIVLYSYFETFIALIFKIVYSLRKIF